MKLLDKALGAFGLQRAVTPHARPQAIVGPGYSFAGAAHNRRFNNFHFGDEGPNAALVGDLETLRSRSRQFYRDYPWAKAAVDKLTNQIIGDGRRPRFSSKSTLSTEQKTEALDFFARVSDQLDATRTCAFIGGMQELALKAMFRDGEQLGRFRPRRRSDRFLIPMQLQLLEADQLPLIPPGGIVDPQRVIGGVEVDGIGAPIAYHFLKNHPRDQVLFRLSSGETSRVPFDEVVHLFIPNRSGQRRGEPLLHAAIVLMHQLQMYQEAELDRKVLAASWGATIEDIDMMDFPGADRSTEDTETGQVKINLGPNTITSLPAGKKATINKTDDIPQSYHEFYALHGHQIATDAFLTYGQLTGDYAESSYSSERAGENCVRRMQTAIGKRMDYAFNQPVWMQVMYWGHQVGALKGEWADPDVRRQYELVEWQAPAFDWIDPLKDAEADALAEDMGWVSKSHNIRIRGLDPDEVFEERAEDEKKMAKLKLMTPGRGAGRGPMHPPEPQPKPSPRKETVQ